MAIDWNGKIQVAQTRLRELLEKRSQAIGAMADATSGVRQTVIDHYDSQIAETQRMIESFEWAKQRHLEAN